jgi:Zn-finger nucleic acid-binding protein
MTRFRVCPTDSMTVERCPACAGIWFDSGEWNSVLTVVPLARIQHVFNDTYQHKLSLELKRLKQEQRCRTILGDSDYDRAVTFKSWMNAHPKRDVLLALIDDRDASA